LMMLTTKRVEAALGRFLLIRHIGASSIHVQQGSLEGMSPHVASST